MFYPLSKQTNKSSKISQSAIEIIKNNPVNIAITQKVTNNALLSPNLPQIPQAKISNKPYGNIMSYSANTHNGLIRGYNEDRISIVLDLKKPGNKSHIQSAPQKKVSFFAVFDGHGGPGCAEFLRD